MTVTRWAPRPARAFRYNGMVATRVFPSPVAISAILPWWSTMAPISCTSYGTMSQFILLPVTTISVPRRRRHASRTVANASGRISSKTARVAPESSLSASDIFRVRLSRFTGSSECRRSSRRASMARSCSPTSSRIRSLKRSVCALSSSSEKSASRSSCRRISSMIGCSFFIERSKRVPNTRLIIPCIAIMQLSRGTWLWLSVESRPPPEKRDPAPANSRHSAFRSGIAPVSPATPPGAGPAPEARFHSCSTRGRMRSGTR